MVALGAVFFTSCDEEETLGFEFGKVFILSYGEEAVQEGGNLKVKFADVIEDSRCPKDVVCIWQGQAKVRLTLSGTVNESIELISQSGDSALAKDTVNNLVFTLLDVTPYPVSTDSIAKEEYKIELQVDSL